MYNIFYNFLADEWRWTYYFTFLQIPWTASPPFRFWFLQRLVFLSIHFASIFKSGCRRRSPQSFVFVTHVTTSWGCPALSNNSTSAAVTLNSPLAAIDPALIFRSCQALETKNLDCNAWKLNWLGWNDEQISDGRFGWSSSWVILIPCSYQHDINKFHFLLGMVVFWNPLGAILWTTLAVGIVADMTNGAAIRWWRCC